MATEFKACSVDGCNRAAAKGRSGLCSMHYKRLWRHGDPLKGRTPDGEPKRFIHEAALPYKGKECLFWPFASNAAGAAQFRIDGKTILVTRYICEITKGPPPTESHEAAHSCGKGHLGCISPSHLSWKTPIENAADKFLHGTINRGEKCPTSILKEPQVKEIIRLKGKMTQPAIATLFGVKRSTINNIHNGYAWSWLQDS